MRYDRWPRSELGARVVGSDSDASQTRRVAATVHALTRLNAAVCLLRCWIWDEFLGEIASAYGSSIYCKRIEYRGLPPR